MTDAKFVTAVVKGKPFVFLTQNILDELADVQKSTQPSSGLDSNSGSIAGGLSKVQIAPGQTTGVVEQRILDIPATVTLDAALLADGAEKDSGAIAGQAYIIPSAADEFIVGVLLGGKDVPTIARLMNADDGTGITGRFASETRAFVPQTINGDVYTDFRLVGIYRVLSPPPSFILDDIICYPRGPDLIEMVYINPPQFPVLPGPGIVTISAVPDGESQEAYGTLTITAPSAGEFASLLNAAGGVKILELEKGVGQAAIIMDGQAIETDSDAGIGATVGISKIIVSAPLAILVLPPPPA